MAEAVRVVWREAAARAVVAKEEAKEAAAKVAKAVEMAPEEVVKGVVARLVVKVAKEVEVVRAVGTGEAGTAA